MLFILRYDERRKNIYILELKKSCVYYIKTRRRKYIIKRKILPKNNQTSTQMNDTCIMW